MTATAPAKPPARRKAGHVPLSAPDPWKAVETPLAAIRPAPENDLLYRPVDSADPDLQRLADSIAAHGVLEPLVATADGVLVSGHRRYAACRLAGLISAPVRRLALRRDDPDFPAMLAEFNRQRVKSFDEQAREAALLVDPEEAYEALLADRKLRAAEAAAGPKIAIDGAARRKGISPAKAPMLAAIQAAVEASREYWPLTDRQIHYLLLNDPPLRHARKPESRYRNDERSYKSCCELLTRARIAGLVAFEAIHDPTRTTERMPTHPHVGAFVAASLDRFLKGYFRDLLQSQPLHLEVIAEKLTVKSIVETVADRFTASLSVGRGYASLPLRHDIAERFRRGGKETLALVFVSDFDPEGEDIAHSFVRSLRDDFGIPANRLHATKAALTAEQVAELALPPAMKAKASSSRRKGFVGKHGENVHELESIPPAKLQALLGAAINGLLDQRLLQRELDAEKQDAARLAGLRKAAAAALPGLLGEKRDMSHFGREDAE